MVKRRISSDEEDQLVNDSSEYSAGESKPKPRSSKREKRTVIKAESDAEHQSEEQQAPSAKKAKKKPTPSTKEQADASGSGDVDIVIHSTPDGDKYIDLGKKKRATVRSFKGTALVDIREFYVADGSEKPGKKGISLALEQWETLKSSSAVIDNLLGSLQKKQK